MNNAKPVNTPVDVGTKLVKATDDSDEIDQGLPISSCKPTLSIFQNKTLCSK